MILRGTYETADGTDQVSAEADTYEEARAALDAALPEGMQLLNIRVDR
ncbi:MULTISPECIES: hypothetical protein [Actinomycetes]